MSFLIIGEIPLLALALLTYFLNGHVLLERESQHLNASLSDLQAFMEDKRFELEKILKDYALWTEDYNAVSEKNGAWLEENIFCWVPEHFGIDFVVLWDKSGSLLGFAGTPSLSDSQTWNYPLEKALRESQFVSGFERLGSSAVLFASGPILKRDSADPPAGVLLFAQKLKPESFPLLEPRTPSPSF